MTQRKPSAAEIAKRWLGRMAYQPCWELMRELVEQRANDGVTDTLLLVEHDPVYTRGRRLEGTEEEVLDPRIAIVDVERGGRITYHGPGQLVAYPIVKLTGTGRDLHRWLRLLEDVVIDYLAVWDLNGTRDPLGTGVFVDGRKIASIGIAVRRWVSFHGFALNVTTDLGAFEAIRPCGFASSIMTSLEREIGGRPHPTLEEVGNGLTEAFGAQLARYPR